jgi:hypothetical protein
MDRLFDVKQNPFAVIPFFRETFLIALTHVFRIQNSGKPDPIF